jgi:hypothetical protein
MLDPGRFSPGVIDGQRGFVADRGASWFQEAKGLQVTGELDPETRQALLNRPSSTVMVTLGPDDVGARSSIHSQENEAQADLNFSAIVTC